MEARSFQVDDAAQSVCRNMSYSVNEWSAKRPAQFLTFSTSDIAEILIKRNVFPTPRAIQSWSQPAKFTYISYCTRLQEKPKTSILYSIFDKLLLLLHSAILAGEECEVKWY